MKSIKNKFKHSSLGLTLIELLITIAIIAMLLLITSMAWRNHINKARDSQRKTDLERISTAFEEYFSDNECYPTAATLQNCGSNDLAPYLNKVPCDPIFKTSYCYITDTDNPTCPQNYRILSPMGNDADPIIEKLFCHGEANCGYDAECESYTTLNEDYNYGVSSFNVPLANPTMPTPAPSPSPYTGPLPSNTPGTLACWSGICNQTDPELLGNCPITFSDENICQQYCDASSSYWCNESQ